METMEEETMLEKERPKRSGRLFIAYTVLFTVMMLLVFGRFLYYGKSFIGGADGLSQVGASMHYNGYFYRELFTNWLHGDFSVPMWDLSVGMGMDVLHVLIFNPLQILCGLLFAENVRAGVAVFTIVSLYLAGLAFLSYCRYIKCSDQAALIAVFTYLCNGYILNYCIAQNVFIELYILLPLLLLGTEKLQKEKKSGIYIACIAYLGISLLLNLYTMTLILADYLCVRYICREENRSFKGFCVSLIRPILAYIKGLALAAVLLIPKIYLSMTSGRVGSADLGSLWYYEKRYYADLLTGITGNNEIGIHGFVGVSILALLAVLYLIFAGKEKKYRELRIWGVILLVLTLIPLGGYLTTGFMGYNHRFLFMVTCYFSIVLAVVLPEFLVAVTEKKKKTIGLTLIYLCLMVAAYIWKGISMPYTAIFFAVYIGLWLLGTKNESGSQIKHTEILWLIPVCLEILCMAYLIYEPTQKNYIVKFEDAKTVNEKVEIRASAAFSAIKDPSVYRVENLAANERTNNREANFGTRNDYYALDGYYSYTYADIIETVNDLGISQMGNPFNIYDLDERTALYTLGGVKYLSGYQDEETAKPYGYQLIKKKKVKEDGKKRTLCLYKNQYTLPLMYTYTSYITKENYQKFTPNEKEQAMMQGVILDQADAKKVSGIQETNLQKDAEVLLSQKEIRTRLQKYYKNKKKELAKEKGSKSVIMPFELTKDGIICKTSFVTFTLDLPDDYEGGELYIGFEDLRYTPKNSRDYQKYYLQNKNSVYGKKCFLKKKRAESTENKRAKITVKADGVQKTAVIWGKDSQYDTGKRDVLFHLGYSAKGRKEITITCKGMGEYDFSDIYVLLQPMEHYAEYYQQLKSEAPDYVKIQGNQITAKVQASKDEVLCVAVPYHRGWSAKVNGKKTEIMQANGMYMALPIQKGSNRIQLEYRLPGQKTGGVISILCVILLFGEVCVAKVRKA